MTTFLASKVFVKFQCGHTNQHGRHFSPIHEGYWKVCSFQPISRYISKTIGLQNRNITWKANRKFSLNSTCLRPPLFKKLSALLHLSSFSSRCVSRFSSFPPQSASTRTYPLQATSVRRNPASRHIALNLIQSGPTLQALP